MGPWDATALRPAAKVGYSFVDVVVARDTMDAYREHVHSWLSTHSPTGWREQLATSPEDKVVDFYRNWAGTSLRCVGPRSTFQRAPSRRSAAPNRRWARLDCTATALRGIGGGMAEVRVVPEGPADRRVSSPFTSSAAQATRALVDAAPAASVTWRLHCVDRGSAIAVLAIPRVPARCGGCSCAEANLAPGWTPDPTARGGWSH
jgi:hypothetical protein